MYFDALGLKSGQFVKYIYGTTIVNGIGNIKSDYMQVLFQIVRGYYRIQLVFSIHFAS